MKKVLIYILLSTILIVPITVILVLAILQQPESSYTEYSFSNNYDDLSTGVVEKKDLEEVVSCEGYLDGVSVVEKSFEHGYSDGVMSLIENDEYVTKDTVLCVIGEIECKADCDGKVIGVFEYNNKIVYRIKEASVNRIVLDVDVDKYPYIEDSSVVFNYGGKQYNASYLGKSTVANNDGKNFKAFYSIKGSEFVLEGRIGVNLKTGKIAKSANVVEKKYIFSNDAGRYYVEVVDPEIGIKRVYVVLGIMGENVVEIIPIEDTDVITEGTIINENSKDVFSKESSKDNTGERTDNIMEESME